MALLAALLPLAATAGGEIQPHETIREAVEGYLGTLHDRSDPDTELRVGHIDPRLRLAQCDEPLEVFAAPGSQPATIGNATLGVRCAAPAAWTIYLSASVVKYAQMAVSTRPIARGSLLSPEDLQLERRQVTNATREYHDNLDAVIGQVATRPMAAGTTIASNSIEAPRLVRRRDQVMILSGSSGFEVRMRGTALDDGAYGERIRVRNDASRREIDAVVTAVGEVRVR